MLSNPTDPPGAAPRTGEALIAGYEELRSQVLAGCGHRIGMTLFLRHGMRSWIEAWRSSNSSAPAAQRGESHPNHTVAVDLRSEIAMLLTSMVLKTHTEVSQ